MASVTYQLSGTGETTARTFLRTRGFDLIVDEPHSRGGDDLGPSPMEYLLAAIAGCANASGHRAARKVGIVIKELKITIRARMDTEGGNGPRSSVEPGLREIEILLDVDTDAGSGLLSLWAEEVRSRCPLADNLRKTVPLSLHVRSSVSEVPT